MTTENFIDDAEDASFSLNGMVAGFDENTSAYAHMPTKNPYSHFCFALNIEMTAEEMIQALKKYLAELEQGVCREVLCIEKRMMRKEYWAKGGQLRRNLLAMRERLERERMISAILKAKNGACYDDFLNRLDDCYAKVARLLGEIHQKMIKMTRQMYGQFYQHLKTQYDAEPVKIAYDEWMMKEGDNTFETLKGKQTLVVAEFLRKCPLRFLRTPIQSEIDKVDIERIIYWLPYNYDREYLRSDVFRIQCAKFRRFATWEGDILKLDYEALGKDLFRYYYKMTDEERQAFFDLDVMLGLINRDIKPTPAPSLLGGETEPQQLPLELSTFAAMALWKKAQAAGWVDANYQPTISRTQAALLADAMAERLKIENKWKVFETLWKRKNMSSDYTRALSQIQSLSFQDKIKALFVTGT